MAKDQELLQAVKCSDLNAFRKIAAKIKAAKTKKGGKKYNINIQDEDGFTATHHACLTGSSEVVMSLIEMECDVNAKDKKGMSPLHLAAWSGKVEVARLLVESGAEVDSCCANGDTPLILACQHGNSDVAEVLLDRKCNSLTFNNNGETALDLACRFGHVHAVELLLSTREARSALSHGGSRKTDPPLHLACKTGHMEIVRMLLEADADVNQVTSNGTCLHEAALYGKTEVVKFLLEWGIDANIKNDEDHTALDVVNLFTSSKASAEIKQLLKDAADADSTVYAKAVRDHFNMLDSTALPFKAGDTIIVLEQNQKERWKGKVVTGDKEKVGYFPGNFVKLTSPRKGSSAKNAPKLKDAGVLPVGSYQMVALPPVVPPSPGFQRNSPRLSSFGKKAHRHGGGEDGEENPSPVTKRALFEPVLPEKGLKAKKGSVKLASGPGLQYVEVEVDKVPVSPPSQSPNGTNQINAKTQYAEVRLPGTDGIVEEVDECEDLPQLPEKENKKPSVSNEMEDIWVRNSPQAPPSLPPKNRAADSCQSTFKTGRPPAALPQDVQPAGHSNPAGHSSPEGQPNPAGNTGLEVVEQPSRRGASPELSRKGYEDMSLPSVRAQTPPSPEDIWKPLPVNLREQPKQQPQAYENVQLPNRGKPANDMQSMIISEVDQPGEGEDGYVIVNTPASSKPTDPRGYENVTPGGVTPVKYNWDNISSDVNYVAMTGGISADSAQINSTSNSPAEQGDNKTSVSSDSEGSKEGMDYEMMKSSAVSVNHQYVNINRQGDAGNPSEAAGQIPLKMRDYNALFDWLEKFRLTIYIDNFVKGGFDMTSVLGITAEDLTAISVTKTGHRKKILSESSKLEKTMSFPKEKPKDIMTWLRLIGLEQYIPEFMDGGFDDMDFLQDMTLEDLVAIGVTKPGHQRKIWMAVNALKEGDENENVLESVEQEEELTPQERKGYLETCLDGEDSGVSTDEVEPSDLISESAPTDDDPMEFSPPTTRENANEEPFVEDSSSAESEIPETTLQQVLKEEISHDDAEQQESSVPQVVLSEVPQTPDEQDEGNLSNGQLEPQEKDSDKKEVDTSLSLHEETVFTSPDSEDDEPPPRPPPPMEEIDLPRHVADSNQNEIDFNGAGRSVKDLVSKENDRIRTFSLDSTFERPKKPPPPAVKPKSFKKTPPPKVPPKPRKAASFTGGYVERSSGEESVGDRSPTKSISPVDRRSSTGSSPYYWPSPPGLRPPGNGNGSFRSRSSSASSQSSVDSIIEEFEERRKSFERPGRKISAPERLNTSYAYQGGVRKSQADAARGDGELDEQIKQILRNRSREDLTQASPTEPSVSSATTVPHFDYEAESLNTEEKKKEQELAEDLMKDINNMLSDFSTELDSMFE